MQSVHVPLSAAFIDCIQILTVGYKCSEGGNYVLFLTFTLGPYKKNTNTHHCGINVIWNTRYTTYSLRGGYPPEVNE